MPNDPACPCGSGRSLARCCGRFLNQQGQPPLSAPDPETLMRSRYTAYVLKDSPYLLATWHPRTRPAELDLDDPHLRWLGLEVRRHSPIDETHAEVEFVARSRHQGRGQRMHVTSRFVHEEDHWLYLDDREDFNP
jgi:SEC-C motif domain protein